MFNLSPVWKIRLIIGGIVLAIIAVVGGITTWYKFFRQVDDGPFTTAEERFKYGSIGGEASGGLPYWIWAVLPRIFPDKLPGSGQGGYYSFGLVWEQGHEMPVGFTKKIVGFPRVANNCAICHAATYRTKADEPPSIVAAAPNHTGRIQLLLRFLTDCAADPRFNADVLLPEIEKHTKFSLLDRLAWRYAVIPMTKKALVTRGGQFAWMNRSWVPAWGPGRDDPMNLTKYFMTSLPVDNTVGQADFPSIWNLGLREGKFLNWGGETPSPRSVIIDSALGLQADPKTVVSNAAWIEDYLVKKRAPKYPYPIDAQLAGKGKTVFDANCNSCHGLGAGTRVGQIIDVHDVGTDDNRLITWTAEAARIANEAVAKLGVDRIPITKPAINGYQAVPLDGIWLRAPYLHNGSVPNLRELLKPPAERSKTFYRGYDVYDPVNVGFDTQSADARQAGFLFDVSLKGNGNGGHLYGTTLQPPDKDALVEYMKTLGPNEGQQ
jgi:mono/diheme cytochrome c family protein